MLKKVIDSPAVQEEIEKEEEKKKLEVEASKINNDENLKNEENSKTSPSGKEN